MDLDAYGPTGNDICCSKMTVDSDKLGYKLHPDRVQRQKNKIKQINWFSNGLFFAGCSLYKSADKIIRVYNHLWLYSVYVQFLRK